LHITLFSIHISEYAHDSHFLERHNTNHRFKVKKQCDDSSVKDSKLSVNKGVVDKLVRRCRDEDVNYAQPAFSDEDDSSTSSPNSSENEEEYIPSRDKNASTCRKKSSHNFAHTYKNIVRGCLDDEYNSDTSGSECDDFDNESKYAWVYELKELDHSSSKGMFCSICFISQLRNCQQCKRLLINNIISP